MHIALLEDEPALAQEVRMLLQGLGHSVVLFPDGQRIVRGLLKDTFDLFVLDWHVPSPDGLQVLQHIRQTLHLSTPVIFLTSKNAEDGLALALNLGADDYCVKPLRPVEFCARIGALQRRFQPAPTPIELAELFEGFVFQRSARRVLVEGQPVALTEKEFDLALVLFQNFDRPLARNRLMQEVWGREEDALSRTLDVHISWLRRKLGIGAQGKRVRLNVVFGYGYRLMKVIENEQGLI